MALGDHRYSQQRWRNSLTRIVLSPERRVRLLRRPEHAAEVWGFCPAGRAFLRILNAVAARHGEAAIQRWVEEFLALLTTQPEAIIPLFGACALMMRDPGVVAALEGIAGALGYAAQQETEGPHA